MLGTTTTVLSTEGCGKTRAKSGASRRWIWAKAVRSLALPGVGTWASVKSVMCFALVYPLARGESQSCERLQHREYPLHLVLRGHILDDHEETIHLVSRAAQWYRAHEEMVAVKPIAAVVGQARINRELLIA